jgi:DNA modification methylase
VRAVQGAVVLTPYYADESVSLYLGDCREVLADLDLQADLIVADPPYGETSLSWDRWPTNWPCSLSKRSTSMWCFGSMRMFIDRAEEFHDWKLSQDVVWEKHRRSGLATDRFARIHEHATHWYVGAWGEQYHETPKVVSTRPLVATARRAAIEPGTRGAYDGSVWEDDGTRWQTTIIRARAMHRNGAINETQKPVGVVEPLISYACPPGGLVLDPFAGSCTTLVAARNLGRSAVGIEMREEQCAKAAARLSEGVLDFGASA